jgi:hypothetical protein
MQKKTNIDLIEPVITSTYMYITFNVNRNHVCMYTQTHTHARITSIKNFAEIYLNLLCNISKY